MASVRLMLQQILASRPPARALLLAVTAALVSTVLAVVVARGLPHANLSLVFVAAVLTVAASAGLLPAIVTGLLSVLAYNYFFTTPYFTLRVATPGDVGTLAFFAAAAVLTAAAGARLRQHVASVRDTAARFAHLHEFSSQLAGAFERDAVFATLVGAVESLTGSRVRVASAAAQAGQAGGPVSDAAPQDRSLDSATSAACFAIAGSEAGHGMLSVATATSLQQNLIRAMCSQAAMALDRIRLAGKLAETRAAAEAESLRSALLSSVSHDLRTPLASIIGSTTSLLDFEQSLSSQDRRELLSMVLAEAERLNRYIQNLLDMTRLSHGSLIVRREWTDVRDIVGAGLQRLRGPLATLRVNVDIADEVPLMFVHAALLEQALVNILENAARHAPAGSLIRIDVGRQDGEVVIDVIDQGPGIPPAVRERVFDMFYTAFRGDTHSTGTGLGLAISLGFVGAHGGTIEVLDAPAGSGAWLRIRIPADADAATDGAVA